MRRTIVVALIGFLLILASQNAFGFMQCGNRVVNEGESKLDVLIKCGEPDLKEVSQVVTSGRFQKETGEPVNRGTFAEVSSATEVWHYNCGDGRLNKSLVFLGGELARIQTGTEYGTGPQKCN